MSVVNDEMPAPTLQKIHTCKSCGQRFEGNFCNHCGEKFLVANDRTFKTFLNNFLLALTVTDSKFIKTLWMVIRHPGKLSAEYVEGRRVNHFRPLQLFFVLNLFYFLFPVLQLFNTSLYTQMNLQPHRRLARYLVHEKIGTDPLALQGYSLAYNDKSTSLAKLLIIIFVLLACIPMAIIYRRRNRFFTDHTVLAVELTSFNLAVNAIALSGIVMVASKLFHMGHSGFEQYLNDTTFTIIFIATNLYFLISAGRTFYNQKGIKLAVKVILGMLGLFVALEVYRLLLFLITFWALG
jgi:hypothetical protein